MCIDKLAIIIPVYNEGDNIKALLDRILRDIKTPVEANIIYDFDEDTTLPVLAKIKGLYPFPVRAMKNAYGKGALNAIKTGLRHAGQETMLVVMADLSDSLEIADEMFRKITEEGCDIVCGSRYMKGGSQQGGPKLKRLLSRIAGLSLHWLTGIPTHDISNSFKMYRKSVIDTMEIESDGGFEIGMELTVKAFAAGYKIVEIPSSWEDRTTGESRFHLWEWLPKYLKWYGWALKQRFKLQIESSN
jgi:dolichol-phosphate mannosyltransferase